MGFWVTVNGLPVPPILLLGCLAVAYLYFRGWRILVNNQQRVEAAKGGLIPFAASSFVADQDQSKSWQWRGLCFLGAIIALLLAASAPIDTLSSRFFWIHMVQHLLLLIVTAPLCVAGAPCYPLWMGMPGGLRRLFKALASMKVGRAFYWLGRALRRPVISIGLLFIGTWLWHWPALYDLALTNETVHDWLEHSTFLAVSIIYWTQVIPSPPFYPIQGYLKRIAFLGAAIAQNVALAALIGFAPAPLYAPYAHQLPVLGQLTPLQDQQFGAGIMWTFGDVPFGVAISIFVQRWLASQSDDTEIAVKSQRSAEG